MSEVSVALLRISHVAIQIQSQRAHGKVLKAVHSAWNLSVCLGGQGKDNPSEITAGLWSGQLGSQGRGGGPGGKAHLLVQAHEAQGIASIPHLVHDPGAEHCGREGDEHGPVVSSWDDLAGTQ